jgi:heptose I phosphotransferase
LANSWQKDPPKPSAKWAIINKIAEIARILHTNGVNHRDFYLCHFLLEARWLESQSDDEPELHVIDLHRTQIREQVPYRWLLKDLAGLYFSCLDTNLTKRDLFRFINQYSQKPLKESLRENASLWTKVEHKAKSLYAKLS